MRRSAVCSIARPVHSLEVDHRVGEDRSDDGVGLSLDDLHRGTCVPFVSIVPSS